MHDIKKILVVSLSTSTCQRAIHYGVTLARTLGAQLHVFHSVYDPFALEGWNLPVPSLESVRQTYLATQEQTRKQLDKFIHEETSDLNVKVTVNEEPMLKEVERIVKNEKIDLIIVVQFEEGRLEHFLFSGNIHTLVREMPCSVLLVKGLYPWEITK